MFADLKEMCYEIVSADEYWFVLRVTYQRELSSKEKLDKLGITNFVPSCLVRRKGKAGRFVWETEVAIHNYIFVRTTAAILKTLKQDKLPWLRYVMRKRTDGSVYPQIVPDNQMNSFIAVAGNSKERGLFLDPDTIDLTKGDRVRILAGPFEGVEGVFIRVRSKHEKRVVVKIDGITAVATTSLPGLLVEKIEK